jgi:pyruvate formate lyase activating enzyme
LDVGGRGVCGVRWNVDGRIVLLAPNHICAVGVDPIEKKPLYHVVPGTAVLSVACAGCTLRCLFCQNTEIAHQDADTVPSRELPPQALVEEMRRRGCSWVAYTYTEPFAWFEYTRACCQAIRDAGGRNLLVTAGYAEEGPVRALAPLVTAANVDLKAMSEQFYREVCGGSLRPVLRTLELLRDAGVHIEVTNLLIPGWNDREEEIAVLGEWVGRNLGTETPLHFSRFFPRHQMSEIPPTPPETLRSARATALQAGLKHVYVGNMDLAGASDTACPKCGTVLVRRHGYDVQEQRVLPNGHCPDCATPVKGVWA